jgi:hypothetical protein
MYLDRLVSSRFQPDLAEILERFRGLKKGDKFVEQVKVKIVEVDELNPTVGQIVLLWFTATMQDNMGVVPLPSALRAIEEITEQGEGRKGHRENSYFVAFVTMLKELLESKASGSGFSPSRPAMQNPSSGAAHGYGSNPNPLGEPTRWLCGGTF